MPLIEITKPAVLAVSAAEVKASARIDGDEFDSQLPLIIAAVIRSAEALTGRVFITRTMELVIDEFPCGDVNLLLPDVKSLESVIYVDANGDEQTLSNTEYQLDGSSYTSFLRLGYQKTWPQTRCQANAVRIRFTAGYGDAADDVPENVRWWIIAHCTRIIQNPEGMADRANASPMPFIDGLLDGARVWRVA